MKALLIKNFTGHSISCLIMLMLLMGTDIARADGDIDNQGTLIIKGNLVNLNATATDLGTGIFEFSGTSAQEISGTNVFGSLRIANTGAGVTIVSGDQKVNTALKLKSGLLTLGSNYMLLGPSATDSGGSVSAMVVATGTGELRKEFAGISSFTFPVGDADVTAEYSPVTVDFTDASFDAGNYLGVNLKNLRDPALATDNYLKRYWTLNSDGITNINCQLTFNFVDADFAGTTIADLYCLKTLPVPETLNKYVSGNQLTGTVTTFGRFTGANIIDITPNITTEPSVMHGVTPFNIIVQVTELNFGNTNGLITVLLPKDTRWGLTYISGATMIGSTQVNNSAWSYTSTDPDFHIFTSTTLISKGTNSKFGFTAGWNAGATTGSANITSQITSGSGGEYRIDNNVDAEKLDYFIN